MVRCWLPGGCSSVVTAIDSSGQGSWTQCLATAVSFSTTLLQCCTPSTSTFHLYTDKTLFVKRYLVSCVFRMSEELVYMFSEAALIMLCLPDTIGCSRLHVKAGQTVPLLPEWVLQVLLHLSQD